MTTVGRSADRSTVQVLALATVLDTAGTGLFSMLFPLFLLRERGFSVTQVGVALSIATACGLLISPAVGHLGDRTAFTPVLIWCNVTQCLFAAVLPFCTDYSALLVALAANGCASESGRVVRYALIGCIGGSDRVALRARLRVMNNVGLSVGFLIGGLVLQADRPGLYIGALLANAASFAATAALQTRLPVVTSSVPAPRARSVHRRGRTDWRLADRSYLIVTALNGVLYLETRVLNLGLPLWIVTRSALPRWTVSSSFLVNTLLVIALQVRLSRGVVSPATAGRSWSRAGAAFLASCSILPLTAYLRPSWCLLILILGVVAHSCGEMWHMAGSFELAFDLAPSAAPGRYQGIFNLGEGLSRTTGPLLVSLLCVSLGWIGWVLMGTLLAGAGWAGSRYVVRRCARLPLAHV